MLQQVVLGTILMLVTTAIHAACTGVMVRLLLRTHAITRGSRSAATRLSLISAVVVMMFFASLLEASTWTAVYLMVGALPDLETALYFSTVTFTTLGYGDVTLNADWRLLGAIQAANGTIMFGWTTAIVVAVVHRMLSERIAAAA